MFTQLSGAGRGSELPDRYWVYKPVSQFGSDNYQMNIGHKFFHDSLSKKPCEEQAKTEEKILEYKTFEVNGSEYIIPVTEYQEPTTPVSVYKFANYDYAIERGYKPCPKCMGK